MIRSSAGICLVLLLVSGCSSQATGHDHPSSVEPTATASSTLPPLPEFSSFTASAALEPEAESEVPNDYDLAFTVQMIPHHQAAVDMSTTLLEGSDRLDPTVQKLAEWVIQDQQREIDQMKSWLDAWDQAVPDLDAWHPGEKAMAAVGSGMGGMEHDMDGMSGMTMDGAEMTHWYLTGMIPHHQGAIDMAGVALTQGSNYFIKQLGNHMVTEQQLEIDAMESLLEALGH